MRIAVAFHLPVARNNDIVPFGTVEILLEEIFRQSVRPGEIFEFPCSVKQFEIRRSGTFAGYGIIFVVKRRINRMSVHFIDSDELLIFPIVHIHLPFYFLVCRTVPVKIFPHRANYK